MTEKFMFYRNFFEAVPEDKRKEVCYAIANYVFNGVEPEDDNIRMIINLIKPSLDKKVGGAPLGNNNAQKQPQKQPLKQGLKQPLKQPQKQQLNSTEKQQTKTETETKTETITETETETEGKTDEDFEMFWSVYPKQRIGNKQKALQAWQRVLKEKRATTEQMIKACANYADSDEVKRGYAKGCVAWLNDDRFNQWLDVESAVQSNIYPWL